MRPPEEPEDGTGNGSAGKGTAGKESAGKGSAGANDDASPTRQPKIGNRAAPGSGKGSAGLRQSRGTSGARKSPKPANKRAVARFAAVQALYQMDQTGSGARDIVKEFELFRLRQDLEGEELRAIDMNWFDGIVTGVVAHQRAIDTAVDDALKAGWPLKRIDLTLRAVLRAGTFELMFRDDVPVRVVISEYVETAKAFFSEDEPRLANGVLDTIARDVRPTEFSPDAKDVPHG